MRGLVEKKFFDDRYEMTCTIPPECFDVRIDLFVQMHFPNFTREFIKKKIEKGQVKILTRDARVKPSSRLKPWDKVFVVCYRENIEDEYWNGEKIELEENLEVIYSNDNFCVINKPPFMCAHPTGRHVFYCATVYAERLLGVSCSTVHRLDRETSGLLILSKNPEYGHLLSSQFERHLVQKFYFFISLKTKNVVFPFTAKERIGESADPSTHSRLFMHCFSEADIFHGKPATTHFDVVYENEKYICGLAIPKSGRQHQIRTHAAHHGMPLIGDKIYFEGRSIFEKFKDGVASPEDHDKMMIPRHALHAAAIEFQALSLNPKKFFAPLPKDLREFIDENIGVSSVVEEKLQFKINEWLNLLKNEAHP